MACVFGTLRKVDWDMTGQVAVMMALCGLVVGVAMLLLFGRAVTDEVPALGFGIAATAGGGIAGGVFQSCFGHGGFLGAQKLLLGMVGATWLGAGLAGVMVLPLDDMILVVLALMFGTLSPIILVWLVVMALVQTRAHKLRQRRAARDQVTGRWD